MKAKASVTAQKLLNLYRQAHVIDGGWAVLNPVFMDEATEDVMRELVNLPTGKMLVEHIKNLRSGETPMDSIARELLPYGGMMVDATLNIDISSEDIKQLIAAVNVFTPNQDGLNNFMKNPVIKKFGTNWIALTQSALGNNPTELERFDDVVRTWNAYRAWDSANNIISNPINDRARAQLQVDMLEYETYLPMFGEAGHQILDKLHDILNIQKNGTSI